MQLGQKEKSAELLTPATTKEQVTGGGKERTVVAIGNGQLNQMSMSEQSNTLDTMHDQQAVMENNTAVRRLMPIECERLQGMPDDWSKYGVNEKGETYELPDSARYKLNGNGIATPFWRYLMKRISAQYERTPTMGSLFDGQASFPMIWEGINGSGSAVWSSEIDKHAVSVAKYHFPDDEASKQ